MPAPGLDPSTLFANAIRTPATAPADIRMQAKHPMPPAAPGNAGHSLFAKVTGSMFGWRSRSQQVAPVHPREAESADLRVPPLASPIQPGHAGDEAPVLEIPAFLRRQNNIH